MATTCVTIMLHENQISALPGSTADANIGVPVVSSSSTTMQHNQLEEPALASEESLDPFPTVGTADVAIFWDSENVQIPRWCPASKASEGIRNSVAKFGRIVEKRLYFDSKRELSTFPRMELDLSGFTLVDCPSRNRKETLDKKLIVDVLCFAWERASRGAKACVVLITSDGDYSYVLSRLRDIGVYTVIMYRPDIVAKVLIDNSNVVLSWEYDVLGGPPKAQEEEDNLLDESASGQEVWLEEHDLGERHLSLDSAIKEDEQQVDYDSVGRSVPNTSSGISRELAVFCSVVHEENTHTKWTSEAKIAAAYYQKVGNKDKEMYTAIRTEAANRDFIEWGRRILQGLGKHIVGVRDRDYKGPNFSIETYVRLTPSGTSILNDTMPSTEELDDTLASSFLTQAQIPSPQPSCNSCDLDSESSPQEHFFVDTAETGQQDKNVRTDVGEEIINSRCYSDASSADCECVVNNSKCDSEKKTSEGITTTDREFQSEEVEDVTCTSVSKTKQDCTASPTAGTFNTVRVAGHPKKLGHDAGKFAIFCSAVLNGQYATVREGVDVYSSWAPESSIGTAFYEKVGAKDRDGYQVVRAQATQRHYIEWGRRNLSVPGKPILKVRDRDHREPNFSLETYVRLTYSGLTILNVDVPRKEESDWIPVLPKTHHKPQLRSCSHSTSDVKQSAGANTLCRLFVGGLAWQTTADSMRSYFRQYGPLEYVYVMEGRGFGFVFYRHSADAMRVLEKAGYHIVDNKSVDVKPYTK
eukprot:Nitzschia sp. Nitz4//scaffold105_size73764//1011//3347//NITZ4_005668-RA/size73764-augustus-gene-0.55-mRNA-1//-1//CDS//3329532423//5253//frame0